MISSESISGYLARLASREPTPGGGAAAALHAAQGAALVAMVARYTTGVKYEQHAELVQRIISAADGLIVEALRLADADEHAFQAVINSYKLPSGTEELKAARATSIQQALVVAAQTPAQLIKLAGAGVDLGADGLRPTRAVVVATDDGSTHWYVRSIERAAESAGISCRIVDLGPDATGQVLTSVLKDLSEDPSVNGIILQTPPPPGVGTDELVGHILDHFDIPLASRNVVVIGRSAVVGKPLSLLLLERDAAVTVCHSRSRPLKKYTKSSDIVVVAAGRTGLLNGGHISSGAVVIGVGTNVLPDRSLVGDVDEASVRGVASALTPVPGGVGYVTTSLLLLHTTEAAREQSRALVPGTAG